MACTYGRSTAGTRESSQSLPAGANWSTDSNARAGQVLIDTVNRFKGLEAAVVVVWALDSLNDEKHRELLYVGLSRAKSLMYLAGSPDVCATLSAS